MRIGIYTEEYNGSDGGGFSLTSTIIKEIRETVADNNIIDDFYILYHGGNKKQYKISNTPIEINIDQLAIFKGGRVTQSAEKVYHTVYEMTFHRWHRPKSLIDKVVEKEQIDLIWIMQPSFVQLSVPYIYTIWDLGHRTNPYFPEFIQYDGWFYRDWMNREMATRASYVLIANERGKNDIIQSYNVMPGKIRIVPFPLAHYCFGNEKKPSFNVPEKYFLYPAQFWAHKNHICIIEALNILKQEYGIEVHMIFTGSDHGNKEYIEQRAKEVGVYGQITFAGFVEDEELKWLYKNAEALVYASVLGPNNMPPMEAAYLGCPVVITDIEGHREEMQDGALYFDGTKPEELCKQIMKVLNKDSEIEIIKERANDLVRNFVKIDYFNVINEIFDEFRAFRKMWR